MARVAAEGERPVEAHDGAVGRPGVEVARDVADWNGVADGDDGAGAAENGGADGKGIGQRPFGEKGALFGKDLEVHGAIIAFSARSVRATCR